MSARVRLTTAWPILLAVALVAGPAFSTALAANGDADEADEAEAQFEQDYAPEISEVRRSGDPQRMLRLARDLYAEAREPAFPPRLQRRLLEAVDELAAGLPEGRTLAIDAWQAHAEAFPDDAAEAHERIVTLRQRQIAQERGERRREATAALVEAFEAAADHHIRTAEDFTEAQRLLRRARSAARAAQLPDQAHLTERLEALAAHQRAQRAVQRLRSRYEQDPQNAQLAQQLAMAYVVEMNDPEAAAEYVQAIDDEGLRDQLSLAASDPDALDAADALELGHWYAELADDAANPLQSARLLDRAGSAYRRHLALQSDDASGRRRVQRALDRVDRRRDRLGPATRLDRMNVRGIWTVVFESDNPLDWEPADAPPDMRYVRLQRMDTQDYVIISATHEELRDVSEGEQFIWNGTNDVSRGVHYLGIANKRWRNPYRRGSHIIQITNHRDGYGGWGFGRRSLVNSDQIQMWADQTIATEDMVVMQIAVSPGPLSREEQQKLLEKRPPSGSRSGPTNTR